MAFTVTSPEGVPYIAQDQATLVAWAKEGRIAVDAVIAEDGKPPCTASRHPLVAGVIPGGTGSGGDAVVATMIPYKNPAALIGYYTSIASLIPFLGHLAGPAAIILGVMGFRAVKREPTRKGTAHAWVAVILGSLTTLFYWGIVIVMIIGAMKK